MNEWPLFPDLYLLCFIVLFTGIRPSSFVAVPSSESFRLYAAPVFWARWKHAPTALHDIQSHAEFTFYC